MIRITVIFNGPVKRPWPEREKTINIAETESIESLLMGWNFRRSDLDYLSFAVNTVSVSYTYVLKDDDILEVFLRLGGG